MTRSAPQTSALALVLAALAVGASAPSAADLHKDQRLGFSLKVPPKWTEIPLATNEAWIVARYGSDKVDHWTDPDSQWTEQHRPELRVIAFIDEVINRPDTVEEEDEEGNTVTVSGLDQVYRDYPEYLAGTMRGGGFHLSKDPVQSEASGFPVTEYEVRVEATASAGAGSRMLVTWVFDMEIADIAVEFEVLEKELKSKKATFTKALKSFAEIPRTIPIESSSLGKDLLDAIEISSLTPEERGKRRRANQESEWEKMVASMPEDWSQHELDGVRIITGADEKHAKDVSERVNAVLAWLDSSFPQIGPAEYVRKPLVRVCKSYEEERQFASGSTWQITFDKTEILTHKSTAGAMSGEWGYVCERTADLWFFDRDRQLFSALPPWLRTGLSWTLGSADVKAGKLRFKEGTWEQTFRSLRMGTGEPIPMRQLMGMSIEEFTAGGTDQQIKAITQATKLVRYMATEARGDTREALAQYLDNVRVVLDEVVAEQEAKSDVKKGAPKDAEEEEALFKERQERFKANRERILDGAFERTFGSWTPAKWSSFEKGYLKTL